MRIFFWFSSPYANTSLPHAILPPFDSYTPSNKFSGPADRANEVSSLTRRTSEILRYFMSANNRPVLCMHTRFCARASCLDKDKIFFWALCSLGDSVRREAKEELCVWLGDTALKNPHSSSPAAATSNQVSKCIWRFVCGRQFCKNILVVILVVAAALVFNATFTWTCSLLPHRHATTTNPGIVECSLVFKYPFYCMRPCWHAEQGKDGVTEGGRAGGREG